MMWMSAIAVLATHEGMPGTSDVIGAPHQMHLGGEGSLQLPGEL